MGPDPADWRRDRAVALKPLAGRSPGPDWTATDERFVDPETGKLVRVYYHAASGERRYVAL